MKSRLKQACLAALIAGLVGVGIALQTKSESMVGIVIATSLVGFFFGLVFKLQGGM